MMDKVFVISDLHTKSAHKAFGIHHYGLDDFTVPEDTEVIIVAGDIIYPELVFEKLSQYEIPVVVVAGNHDLWEREITDGVAYLIELAKPYEQIHVLENSVVEIGSTRFIGATLWSDFGNWHPRLVIESNEYYLDNFQIKATKWWKDKNNLAYAEKMLEKLVEQSNNFEQLKFNSPKAESLVAELAEKCRFHPLIAFQLHQQSVSFIEEELAKPHKGNTIVVTHHPPTAEALRLIANLDEFDVNAWNNYRFVRPPADRFLMSPFAPEIAGNYASQHEAKFIFRHQYLSRKGLQSWLGEGSLQGANLWCHGHVHATLDYAFQGTRFVVNALESMLYDNSRAAISLSDGLQHAFTLVIKTTIISIDNAIRKLSKWLECEEIQRIESLPIKNSVLAQLRKSWQQAMQALADFEAEYTRITAIRTHGYSVEPLFPKFEKYRFTKLSPARIDDEFFSSLEMNEDEIKFEAITEAIESLNELKKFIAANHWA